MKTISVNLLVGLKEQELIGMDAHALQTVNAPQITVTTLNFAVLQQILWDLIAPSVMIVLLWFVKITFASLNAMLKDRVII